MFEALFWVYLVNAVLLINHEIESAYWKEWELFKLPGGITFFLVIHFGLIFVLLYGLVLVYQQSFAGLVFSLIACFSGVFAFTIHAFFIRQGKKEFTLPISIFMLVAILVMSLVQSGITVYLLVT